MDKRHLTKVTAEEGECVSVVGDTYRIVVGGEQTNGRYALIDMLVPPNGGPGPHAHPDFEEAFYILEGEIEVKTENETYVAKKGSFVNIPEGGIVHCFKNKTDKIARMLCTVSPAGEEEFFREIGKPVEPGKFLPPPEMTPEEEKRLKAITEKYGQKLYPPDYLD